jgi:hypothetical protein
MRRALTAQDRSLPNMLIGQLLDALNRHSTPPLYPADRRCFAQLQDGG